MCVCSGVFVCVGVRACVCKRAFVYVWAKYVCVCVCVCVCWCVSVSVSVSVSVCVCICLRVRVCARAHITFVLRHSVCIASCARVGSHAVSVCQRESGCVLVSDCLCLCCVPAHPRKHV